MRNFPYILGCPDKALSDVRQSVDILSNGWETDSTDLNSNYEAECDDGDTWYGYSKEDSVGSISATFQGAGTADLSFGNCLNGGIVQVTLNKFEISKKLMKGKKEVTFEYAKGDNLTIREYGGTIWKLYSLTLYNCN